jgi:hypothetical protein
VEELNGKQGKVSRRGTNFNNTANIIKRDLLLLVKNQTQESGNLVRSTKMGEKVKFISDFSGGDQFNMTKDSYNKMVSSLVQSLSVGVLWQIAVYNKNGEIFSFAPIPEGASINDIQFKNGSRMPFGMMESNFTADLPNISKSFYRTLGRINKTNGYHKKVTGYPLNSRIYHMLYC